MNAFPLSKYVFLVEVARYIYCTGDFCPVFILYTADRLILAISIIANPLYVAGPISLVLK